MKTSRFAAVLPRRSSALAAISLLGAMLLVGCAGEKKEEYVERPVGEIYDEAVRHLEEGDYKLAAQSFDEVERQHPYSRWAAKAQLMAAYSYYEDTKFDDAIIALDRFIQLHPGSPDAPYAYYLKALCYYEQISDVGRDQKMTKMAMQSLEEVITRFPNTTYARDARLKVDLTRDHLAGKEMEVGRWYLNNKQYLAAINRFKVVIDSYQQTTHTAEALYRLVESYTMLGLKGEARRVAAVLGHNFPGSTWYQDAYEVAELGSKDPQSEEMGSDGKKKDDSWLPKLF